jgi:hypothetical protein
MNSSSGGEKDSQGGDSVLAGKLTGLGYAGLFQGPDEAALDAIWDEAGAPEALASLAGSPEAPAPARFLAAEILFTRRETYPSEEQKRPLASVYAAALARNFTGAANPWGLPGLLPGLAGEHFVALGAGAIPEIVGLLDDDQRVYYVGSQEATMGNSYQYRVKDLAAHFLSRIAKLPFVLHESPQERDAEIEKLKGAL